jgi:hypothetical protein
MNPKATPHPNRVLKFGEFGNAKRRWDYYPESIPWYSQSVSGWLEYKKKGVVCQARSPRPHSLPTGGQEVPVKGRRN